MLRRILLTAIVVAGALVGLQAQGPFASQIQAALRAFAANATITNLTVTGSCTGCGGSSGAAWGDITGTLSDQTDLQSALDAKAPLASPTLTGNVGVESAGVRLTAADGVLTLLGLGNGADENLVIDLDNAGANTIGFSSGTGVLNWNWASGSSGNNTTWKWSSGASTDMQTTLFLENTAGVNTGDQRVKFLMGSNEDFGLLIQHLNRVGQRAGQMRWGDGTRYPVLTFLEATSATDPQFTFSVDSGGQTYTSALSLLRNANAVFGAGVTATTSVTSATSLTATNCADSAGDAACGSASAGAVVVDATDTTTVVSTTAVTANSEILLQYDHSLGTRLSVTCNTAAGTVGTPFVSARTAATSFTITVPVAPVTDPACITYRIVN